MVEFYVQVEEEINGRSVVKLHKMQADANGIVSEVKNKPGDENAPADALTPNNAPVVVRSGKKVADIAARDGKHTFTKEEFEAALNAKKPDPVKEFADLNAEEQIVLRGKQADAHKAEENYYQQHAKLLNAGMLLYTPQERAAQSSEVVTHDKDAADLKTAKNAINKKIEELESQITSRKTSVSVAVEGRKPGTVELYKITLTQDPNEHGRHVTIAVSPSAPIKREELKGVDVMPRGMFEAKRREVEQQAPNTPRDPIPSGDIDENEISFNGIKNRTKLIGKAKAYNLNLDADRHSHNEKVAKAEHQLLSFAFTDVEKDRMKNGTPSKDFDMNPDRGTLNRTANFLKGYEQAERQEVFNKHQMAHNAERAPNNMHFNMDVPRVTDRERDTDSISNPRLQRGGHLPIVAQFRPHKSTLTDEQVGRLARRDVEVKPINLSEIDPSSVMPAPKQPKVGFAHTSGALRKHSDIISDADIRRYEQQNQAGSGIGDAMAKRFATHQKIDNTRDQEARIARAANKELGKQQLFASLSDAIDNVQVDQKGNVTVDTDHSLFNITKNNQGGLTFTAKHGRHIGKSFELKAEQLGEILVARNPGKEINEASFVQAIENAPEGKRTVATRLAGLLNKVVAHNKGKGGNAEEIIEEYKTILDTNKDGAVSRDELQRGKEAFASRYGVENLRTAHAHFDTLLAKNPAAVQAMAKISMNVGTGHLADHQPTNSGTPGTGNTSPSPVVASRP